MAKKPVEVNKYYKLGAAAASFHDPRTGLSLAHPEEVGKIDAKYLTNNRQLQLAVQNGHIQEVTESDYKASKLKRQSDHETDPVQQEMLRKKDEAAKKAANAKVEDEEDEEEEEELDIESEDLDDEDEEEEDEDDKPKKGKGKK
jgi:hypothetical protein